MVSLSLFLSLPPYLYLFYFLLPPFLRYANLERLAEDRRQRLEESKKRFVLSREMNELKHWITDKVKTVYQSVYLSVCLSVCVCVSKYICTIYVHIQYMYCSVIVSRHYYCLTLMDTYSVCIYVDLHPNYVLLVMFN